MDLLVTPTGIPFRYLIAIGALGALGLVGVLWLASGLRRHRRAQAVTGGVVLTVVVLVGWANAAAGRVKWIPVIRTDAELVGVWSGDTSVLELDASGAFRCHGERCFPFGASGHWARAGDVAIEFTAGRRSVQWRLASRDGQLWLVSGTDLDDEERWHPTFVFRHRALAT